jgi:hypothetical protein
MLKNGRYRLQSLTGLASEVLLFGPDGKPVGHVKRITIEMDPEKYSDVQGTIELYDRETHGTYSHQLLRVHLSAKGIIIDGEAKENPGGSSRQMDFEDLMPRN